RTPRQRDREGHEAILTIRIPALIGADVFREHLDRHLHAAALLPILVGDDEVLERFLVLVADALEQLGVGGIPGFEADGPWPRVGLAILERDLDAQVAEVGTTIALDDAK